MKKLFAVVFALVVGMSTAYAGEVAYTVGSVHDRATQGVGSVVAIATQSGDFGYGLTSINVGNSNRTEVGADYTLFDVVGVTGKVGLGAVDSTNVTTHMVYSGKLGYVHEIANTPWSVGAEVGYKNDFNAAINDRQVTYVGDVAYLLTPTTTLVGAVTRYNGDLKLTTATISCNTSF